VAYGTHKARKLDMQDKYTAVIKKSGKWWIGWIEEVPGVNCQEPTKPELHESLRVTLREALEFNKREAIQAAGDGYDEEPIAL
jgi:hypothetical protein